MDPKEFLHILWGFFALCCVGIFFLIYRFLRALKVSQKRHPETGDLLVETLKDQALRVKLANQERDSSQEALENLDETYRTVTRNIPIGLLVFNREGQIALVNPSLLAMLPDPDRHMSHLSDLPEDLVQQIQVFEEKSEILEKRVEFLWKEQTIIADLSVVALSNGWKLLTLQDKTRVVHLQRHVKTKSDLALMGELASGITHEVKNSLSIISGHLQLLARQPGLKEDRNLGVIEKEIHRLLRVTRQFMQSSKVPSLNIRLTSWDSLLDDLKNTWKNPVLEGRFFLGVPPDSPFSFDAEQLKTVLDNLILNGLEAIGDEGEVHLDFDDGLLDWLVIKVSDTGPGCSKEIKSKLFTPLVTSKPQGSGLGLFQARKIVQAHRGEIKFISNPTVFAVWLPRKNLETSQQFVDDTLG